MSKRKWTELRIEILETLALLSNLPALPDLPAGATGIGSVGSASVADAQALQWDAGRGALERYIAEIELADGTNPNVLTYALNVRSDLAITAYDLQNVASGVGMTLPAGITNASDVRVAGTVLAASRHGAVDRVYLREMAILDAQDVAADVQLIHATQNMSVSLFAQEAGAYDQNHLMGAVQLRKQPRSMYGPTLPTTSLTNNIDLGTPGSAAPADVQGLQAAEAGGSLEVFLAESELQRGTRPAAQAFAQTVVAAQPVTNYDLQATAIQAGDALFNGIASTPDATLAQKFLGSVRRGPVDAAFLQIIEQVATADAANDQQLIATTQDARIGAYAAEDLATNTAYLRGLQALRA